MRGGRGAAELVAGDRTLVDLVRPIGEAQRAMVAPPGVPDDRVEFLRGAFADVLIDPALIEEGAKTKREIEYMGGRDLQRLAK